MSRLWLARHAEATEDESELTSTGRRQATLLGERLAGAGITRISHGPLPRAAETARIVAAHLPGPAGLQRPRAPAAGAALDRFPA
ncbi:MAG: histidine phosphatase family protein [Actinoplanes sp.]